MLRDRFVEIDDADARVRPQRGGEIVEKRIWFGDLMIHMDQDRTVERPSRQARVVWFAQSERDVLQPEPLRPFDELGEILAADVL